MKFDPNTFYYIPLGGVGEIGANLYLYGYKNEWIIIDCGIGFADDRDRGIEIIIPDISFIKRYIKKVSAIVLTHVHEDHYGAIAMLWHELKCPIYGTKFALTMLDNKLSEANLSGRVKTHIIQPKGKVKIAAFDIEFVPVNHSIPEANMLIIRTEAGAVLHTGDWKIDNNPIIGEAFNPKSLKRLNNENLLAVICDSTGAITRGHSESEKKVRDSLLNLVKKYPKGKVAMTCFSSNVVRIETAYLAAKKAGRKLVLAGYSLWKTYEAAQASGYLRKIEALDIDEGQYVPAEKAFYLCTGSQGEHGSTLWKISEGMHKYIRLSTGDTIFFSSKDIPGNEISIIELQNKLTKLGADIITNYEELTHASGHASHDEIAELYKHVKPKAAIPMHGEYIHLSAHARIAKSQGIKKTLITDNGHVIALNKKGGPEVVKVEKVSKIAVDGSRMLDIDDEVIKNRRKISYNGVLFVTATIDPKNNFLEDVIVSSIGLFEGKEYKDDLNIIKKDIINSVKKLNKKKGNLSNLKEEIRVTAKRYASINYDKKPKVVVHIV
jgi:ribonuclease J